MHAKLLLRNGADEVVYPERDSAERLATRLSARNVFDYIELTDEYSIYEIPPLDSWVGRSVRDVDVRNKYHINILAVKEDGRAQAPARRRLPFHRAGTSARDGGAGGREEAAAEDLMKSDTF